MEGLEAATTATAPAPAAPAAAPTPAAPAPVAAAPVEVSADSGRFGGVKEAFQSLNWIEVGFGVLGTAALFSLINYYRYQTMAGKAINTEIQNRLDDISIKVADLQSATQRDELLGAPQQGFDGLFY